MTKWKCKTCKKNKTEGVDPGVLCALCSEWVGLECTSYKPEIYAYLQKNQIEIDFFCKECKGTIPELRNLLEITKQQQKLQEDLDNHDTRITACEVEVEKINQIEENAKDVSTRLATLEAKLIDKETVATIAETCFKKSDFPPITFQEVKKQQKETQMQLEATIISHKMEREETVRREDNKKSLIVYGIKETHNDKIQQMKADFTTIKSLYSNKVELCSKDLLQVIRVGKEDSDKIRPIKLTFVDMQKRLEVLRNNKDLKLYGENLNDCNLDFCKEEKDHAHIYVTTDKTKQQRKEENELRAELKRRKQTEEDLIIRNGRIIKKTTIHARWQEVAQDGW